MVKHSLRFLTSICSIVLLLLAGEAHAKSKLDFTLAVSGQSSDVLGVLGQTIVDILQGKTTTTTNYSSISQITDSLTKSITQSLSTTSSPSVLGVKLLGAPDPILNLPQKALEYSQGEYNLQSNFRLDLQINLESNDHLDVLPLPRIIQDFSKNILSTFPVINAIGFYLKNSHGITDPVFYFPILEEQRRVPTTEHQEIIDFWADHAQLAVPREFVIDEGGNRMLRQGSRHHRHLAVADDAWTAGGIVQTAVGRILFGMGGAYYVCTGTAVRDTATDRSIILTAAHCVYDDTNKVFATNVLFIPNQDATTGTKTDFSCTNDPLGCWTASFGVVDTKWASQTWDANIPADFAYYVVSNTGANSGSMAVPEALDQAVSPLSIDFANSPVSRYGYSLGYPGNRDPDFRYCADTIASRSTIGYLLSGCDMKG
jgi:hypothetical protein